MTVVPTPSIDPQELRAWLLDEIAGEANLHDVATAPLEKAVKRAWIHAYLRVGEHFDVFTPVDPDVAPHLR
jgi:hypothetical protein